MQLLPRALGVIANGYWRPLFNVADGGRRCRQRLATFSARDSRVAGVLATITT